MSSIKSSDNYTKKICRGMKIILTITLLLYFHIPTTAQNWKDLNDKLLAFANDGKMDSAIHYANVAVQMATIEFGKKHGNYVRSLNILALVHDLNNNFKKAEPL